jgi:hypothetical protein
MVSNTFTVRVDATRAISRMKRIARNVEKESDLAGKDLAETGKRFAKLYAPRDTGRLTRLIKSQKGEGKREWLVVSVDPIPGSPVGNKSKGIPPYRWGGNVTNFNLAKWYNTPGSASRRHGFMYMNKAADATRKMALQRLRTGVQKAIIK